VNCCQASVMKSYWRSCAAPSSAAARWNSSSDYSESVHISRVTSLTITVTIMALTRPAEYDKIRCHHHHHHHQLFLLLKKVDVPGPSTAICLPLFIYTYLSSFVPSFHVINPHPPGSSLHFLPSVLPSNKVIALTPLDPRSTRPAIAILAQLAELIV